MVGTGMGRPVQTRPKGPGQIRREAKREDGWMEWAMGTLRGCRRDAVSMDGQEVGERSGGDRSGQNRGSGDLPGPVLDLLPRLRPQTSCPLTDLPSMSP